MKVKCKLEHENAKMPVQGSVGSAGWDLTAAAITYADTRHYIEYDTGLSVEIPDGHVGLLFPRSSVTKIDMMLKNCVGVIDSDYRGTIKLRFGITKCSKHISMYKVGDRVGQLIIMPFPKVEWVDVGRDDSLLATARGLLGFGSSGK